MSTSESFRISDQRPIATGFDFGPLPSGDVLIQFFADDGVTVNTQVVTTRCLARLPVVVHAFFLAVEKGNDAALAFLDRLPADRSLDVMAGMVAEWAEKRFGPPGKSVLAILAEVIARFDRIESSRMPMSQKEIDILEALEEGSMVGEKLAARAGYEYDGHLKGVLSSLVKRRVIGNKRPGGYFLVGKRES